MITLPTAPSPASHTNPKLMLLYGPPKVGKTTALSQLEQCLILDCEDGSDYITALKLKINSFEELREACKAVRDAKCPYKYVAVDTITRVEDWCEKYATALYKQSVIGKSFTGQTVLELPQGSGYFWLRRAFDEVMMMLHNLAPHVILVGHLREKFIGGKDAKVDSVVSSKDLDLTGKIKQIACSRSDAIGYIYRNHEDGFKLWISFESNEQVNCGSRCGHLKGRKLALNWKEIYK